MKQVENATLYAGAVERFERMQAVLDTASVAALAAKVTEPSVAEILAGAAADDIASCIGHIEAHVRDLDDEAKALWEKVKASLPPL